MRLLFFFILLLNWPTPVLAQAPSPLIKSLQKVGEEKKNAPQTKIVVEGASQSSRDLTSKKPDEIISGLSYFERKLPLAIKQKSFTSETFDLILDLTVHNSPAVREAAKSFIDVQMDNLIKAGFAQRSLVEKRAERVYKSTEDLVIYLTLMSSLLKNETGRNFIGNESTFFVTDGLASANDIAAELAADILTQHNATLIALKIWDDRHIQILFNNLATLKAEHRNLLIPPLRKHLAHWSELGFIVAKDVRQFIIQIFRLPNESRETFVNFICEKTTLEIIRKAGVLSSEWMENLLDAFEGDDQGLALSVYQFLCVSLEQFQISGTLKKEHFDRLWNEIAKDPLRVDDPLALILQNTNLVKSQNFLDASSFMSMIKILGEGNAGSQSRLLSLLEKHHKQLNSSNLIDRGWLQGWLLGDPGNDTLHEKKILYLAKYQRTIGSATPNWIRHVLENDLQSGNTQLAQAAFDLMRANINSWIKAGRFKSSDLERFVGALNPNRKVTASLVDWLTSLYSNQPQLFSSSMISSLENLFDSPESAVVTAAQQFFFTHREALIAKELWPKSLKKK